jgi:hypothetical protein
MKPIGSASLDEELALSNYMPSGVAGRHARTARNSLVRALAAKIAEDSLLIDVWSCPE